MPDGTVFAGSGLDKLREITEAIYRGSADDLSIIPIKK
jgi:hypothetical protein